MIMVINKSGIELEDVHLAQALNYLEAFQQPIGLLINFGAKSLQFKDCMAINLLILKSGKLWFVIK